jgi:putative transposase
VPYWKLFYHLVWATKNREPMIGPDEEAVIRRSLKLTFADLDVIPHAVGMMPDHIQVVVSAPPKISPAELVRRMKGASSRAINEQIARWEQASFTWQREYGVHSFGAQALPTIIAYVTNQPAHHAAKDLWSGLERSVENARGARSTSRFESESAISSGLEPTSVTEPGN